MKTTSYLPLLVLLGFSVFLWSCEPEEPKEEPNFTLKSTEGMNLSLNWDIGTTNAEAIKAADLDLRVFRGTALRAESVNTDTFETINLAKNTSNSRFSIAVEMYNSTQAVDYTLLLEGGEDAAEKKTFMGTLNPNEHIRKLITVIDLEKADSVWNIYLPK